jgi:hypothetical protein
VLVTSRFSEVAVLEQVEQEGLRMIPKSLCQFVPIVIAPQHSADLIVQIDDDPLVRQVWSMLAFSKKLRMRQFGSWDEFFAVEPAIDRGARIYVDVDLGASIGGLDVSRALHEKGFENIYLSTGYYLSAEKVPPFVKGVIGKEPPF